MNFLVLKTFAILAIMLLVTAFASKRNHAFEKKIEFWLLFIGSLILIFVIPATSFPINLGLALVFAFLIGSLIGPGIKALMLSYVTRNILRKQGLSKEQIKNMSTEELNERATSVRIEIEQGNNHPVIKEWNNIFQLALYSTATITIIAGTLVYALSIDFSFLGQILFVSLLGLIVVGLLNIFFFKSPLMRLVSAYVGAVIFSLYLLYDFDQLEKSALTGDVSWETAINFAISIYLDIINLFLDLLEILNSD